MCDEEKISAARPAMIRGMFDRIAHAYDLNNHLHTLWMDQSWRRAAVRRMGALDGASVLDICCGTGDLTRLLIKRGAREVVAVDFSAAMIARGREKLRSPAIRWLQGDALALPFPDSRFDALCIGFGLRNLSDPLAGLREMRRVLRPGGVLSILEFNGSARAGGVFQRAKNLYVRGVMSRTAGMISGDRKAYDYLHESIQSFLTPEALAQLIEKAGFDELRTWGVGFGMVAIHVAKRAVV